jgi:hypothetical protein
MQPQGLEAIALPMASPRLPRLSSLVLIVSSLPVLHGVPFLLVLATDRCEAREPARSPTRSSLVEGDCR